ncbi:MAG TPA: glycine betaine ABC transporter substrate-binding protein [Bryobacteraceae bacterium]|jgi:osmoprotectant transport system substrate-binding protein|nr:glycine betaine ABC transporter substrate-binding protein [Bryobacteraceae bacterium]
MGRKEICGLTLLALVSMALAGCGSSPKTIVVGSKNFTEQVVLGEIIAQHLEHRLGRPVRRQLNLGGTLLTYQALLNGQISLYPEYTGTIEAEILKEPPSPDSAQVFERSRLEMARREQLDLLPSLGFDNSFAMVVRGEDARREKISTLSQAAGVKHGWKLGMGYEFASRIDGMPALNKYHLPMSAPPRSMDLGLVYKALSDGQVTMIAANATDGQLARHDWTVLADDQHAFGSYQACILARQDVEAAEPRLKPALLELSGKLSSETMRKLNAAVDVDHRPAAQVAAEFLAQSGLK